MSAEAATPAEVPNRQISDDAMALRYALKCSIPGIRREALEYLSRVIRMNEGRTMQIVEQLGFDKRTYHRLRQDNPELQAVHEKARRAAGLPEDWSRVPVES